MEVLRNEVEFFEGALHDDPDRLRAAVQERIDATPGEREPRGARRARQVPGSEPHRRLAWIDRRGSGLRR